MIAASSREVKRFRCSHEGCANGVVKGGVCVRHGAKVKLCCHDGCTNYAQKGGVCWRHGAKSKRCCHEGCVNQGARKGGVCRRHGEKSLTTAPQEVKCPPQPPEGCNSTTPGAFAKEGVITGMCNPRTNISLAAAHHSPSVHTSATTSHHSDEDEIGAWIYKSWAKFY